MKNDKGYYVTEEELSFINPDIQYLLQHFIIVKHTTSEGKTLYTINPLNVAKSLYNSQLAQELKRYENIDFDYYYDKFDYL